MIKPGARTKCFKLKEKMKIKQNTIEERNEPEI